MKDKETLKQDVIERLKKIYDPEIPVDIWNMGLVYEVNIDEHTDDTAAVFHQPLPSTRHLDHTPPPSTPTVRQ